MKTKISRFIAILLLVIPGILATYGFLLVKDAFFDQFAPEIGHVPWLKMAFGFILFLLGTGFIGGWIFYRDRKRNYVAPRFKAKRQQSKGRIQKDTGSTS
ncbi:DUF2627 domain-containing protein [Paenibacillus larvae]